jgi:hypothetical protein
MPEELHPLVNSAAPWVLVAFAVALLGRTARVAGVCAVLLLAASEIGYVTLAATRGFGRHRRRSSLGCPQRCSSGLS